MPLWQGSQSPPPSRPRQSYAPANCHRRASPRPSGSSLFSVRSVGSIHSVSVHVRSDGGGTRDCGGGAAAALYNYTLMCIIVEKSGHTRTQYTLSYSYYTKCKTVYLLYVHICREKGVQFRCKIFFFRLTLVKVTYKNQLIF